MTCLTCKHWEPKKAGNMAKHRMAPCGLGKAWTFYGPQHTCAKQADAKKEVTAAREKWVQAWLNARKKGGDCERI